MEKEKNLIFKLDKTISSGNKLVYRILNKSGEFLGNIEKMRVGTYLHWCYCPISDIYLSAGCMDEIRMFIKNPVKYLEKIKNEKIHISRI